MKSEQAKSAAETLLRGIRVQLETAEHELQTLRETINRTNEAVRRSREAILRTNILIQPDEPSKARTLNTHNDQRFQ